MPPMQAELTTLEIIIERPLKPVLHRLAAQGGALFKMGIDPGEAIDTPGGLFFAPGMALGLLALARNGDCI